MEIVKRLGNLILTTSINDNDNIIEYKFDPGIIFEEWQSKVDVVIDSGFGGNVPSTVIDATNERAIIIRQGAGEFVEAI